MGSFILTRLIPEKNKPHRNYVPLKFGGYSGTSEQRIYKKDTKKTSIIKSAEDARTGITVWIPIRYLDTILGKRVYINRIPESIPLEITLGLKRPTITDTDLAWFLNTEKVDRDSKEYKTFMKHMERRAKRGDMKIRAKMLVESSHGSGREWEKSSKRLTFGYDDKGRPIKPLKSLSNKTVQKMVAEGFAYFTTHTRKGEPYIEIVKVGPTNVRSYKRGKTTISAHKRKEFTRSVKHHRQATKSSIVGKESRENFPGKEIGIKTYVKGRALMQHIEPTEVNPTEYELKPKKWERKGHTRTAPSGKTVHIEKTVVERKKKKKVSKKGYTRKGYERRVGTVTKKETET